MPSAAVGQCFLGFVYFLNWSSPHRALILKITLVHRLSPQPSRLPIPPYPCYPHTNPQQWVLLTRFPLILRSRSFTDSPHPQSASSTNNNQVSSRQPNIMSPPRRRSKRLAAGASAKVNPIEETVHFCLFLPDANLASPVPDAQESPDTEP